MSSNWWLGQAKVSQRHQEKLIWAQKASKHTSNHISNKAQKIGDEKEQKICQFLSKFQKFATSGQQIQLTWFLLGLKGLTM